MTGSIKDTLRYIKRSARFTYFKGVLAAYRFLFSTIRNFEEKNIIESTRRQQWFYRSEYPVFGQKHFIGVATDVDAEDIRIAAEIHSYWRKLKNKTVSDHTIWSLELMDANGLVACLDGDDTRRLAVALKGMFHSRYIQGISHGFRHKTFPSSKMLVPVMTEDRLVSLAEYLGVVPVETSEQGRSGIALERGLGTVVEGVEKALGFSLAFPEKLGASGIRVGDRTISKRQIEHIYGACRLKESFRHFGNAATAPSIVEIGGGYGGLCFWTKKLFREGVGKYYIVDLPWVNTFQAFFLKKVFGEANVAFWNDEPERVMAASVVLCSSQDYRQFFDTVPRPDIYLNQDSLPEMPANVASEYLDWIFSSSGSLFFSYQQENGLVLNGVTQNSVHALIAKLGKGTLLTRNLSWTRDGYTEETYSIAKIAKDGSL